MPQSRSSLSRKKGLMPGSFVYTGKYKDAESKIHLFQYDSEGLEEFSSSSTNEIFNKLNPLKINWIILTGLSDTETVATVGKHFGLHPLLLEDALNAELLPKSEETDQHFFLSLKSLNITNIEKKVETSSISLLLGKDYLLTFSEAPDDSLNLVMEHLRTNKNKIRAKGHGFLFYLITDSLVDSYYPIIDQAEEGIEELEAILLRATSTNLVARILAKRKNQAVLRRAINPLLEEIRKTQKSGSILFDSEIRFFLKDIFEHLVQISLAVEGLRDSINTLMELYLAKNDMQMNEVMKRLTVVSTIFIPLTFLVGVWGMNFKWMPELEWKSGYFIAWAIMIVTAGITVWYLKQRRWF
jgi:magnesium transporter